MAKPGEPIVIALTRAAMSPGSVAGPVWVMVAAISHFEAWPHGATVALMDGVVVQVVEAPEQIVGLLQGLAPAPATGGPDVEAS